MTENSAVGGQNRVIVIFDNRGLTSHPNTGNGFRIKCKFCASGKTGHNSSVLIITLRL